MGSEVATEWYVGQVLAAGCAFVNCVPVFIASEECWRQRFAERGLPIIGDDIKSQVGATITHRVLTNLFRERGVRLDRTYQLNTSPPLCPEEFAWFATEVVQRYVLDERERLVTVAEPLLAAPSRA